MLGNLFENLIEVSLSVSVVILLLLLLSKILNKKYTAKWKYLVWLVLAVRLLVPFNMSLSNPPIQLVASDFEKPLITKAIADTPGIISVGESDTSLVDNKLDSIAEVADTPPSNFANFFTEGRFDLAKFLTILWLAGVLFFIAYHSIIYCIFRKKVKTCCTAVTQQDYLDDFSGVCVEMKIHQKIRLMTGKIIRSPMVIGIHKPILLLPETAFNSKQLKMILYHELVHVRRRDILYKSLIFLSRAVHWFNPFVHLMAAEAGKEIEVSCDAEVTLNQNGNFRKNYGETILVAVNNGRGPDTEFSTNFGGGKEILMKRFESLFDMRQKKKGILSFIIVMLIIGIIGLCISCDQRTTATSLTSGNTSSMAFSNQQAVSAGPLHIVGLKKNGTVVAYFSISPLVKGQFDLSNWKDIVSVAAGGEAWAYTLLTVGLKKDGTVISTDLKGNTFEVSSWKDITAISAGAWHVIGLRKDGTVVEAGIDEQHVNGVSSWNDIIAVSAGAMHEVGLKKDGTVVANGDNAHHECEVSTWKDIIAVSAGGGYTIGLRKDGTLVAVGNNQYRTCDVSSWTNIVAISAGNRYAVGLKNDGTVVTTKYGPDISGWTDIIAVSASIATVGLKNDGTVIMSELPNNALPWENIGIPSFES